VGDDDVVFKSTIAVEMIPISMGVYDDEGLGVALNKL